MQISLSARKYERLNWAVVVALLLSILFGIVTHNLLFLFAAPILLLIYFSLHKPGILYYLLLLFIPFSTEMRVTQTLSTDFPDEILMWGLSVIIIVAFIFNSTIDRRKAWSHPLMLLLTIHFFWIITTVIFSVQPLLSLKYAAAKAWYMLCFVLATILFVDNEKKVRLVSVLMVFSVLCTAIFILIKHGFYNFSFEKVSQVTLPF